MMNNLTFNKILIIFVFVLALLVTPVVLAFANSTAPNSPFLASSYDVPQIAFIVEYDGERSAKTVMVVPVLKTADTGMRLEIPKIRVNAQIDPMGITALGAMESPAGSKNVGWFSLGTYPGAVGSAILDGHFGRWKNGNVSVFDNLHKLVPGDKIYVKDGSGVTITFIVRESKMYGKDDLVPEVFTLSDGKSHLNIITCAGTYIESLQTYSNRLVVFADKE